jgi:anti-anti-sigma factor
VRSGQDRLGSSSDAELWDGHILLLHASETERRSGLAAWVRRGLEVGEKVIYAESEADGPQRSVLTVLRQHGVDGDAAVRDGRLQVLPISDALSRGGPHGVVRQALADGYRGVRMSVEARTVLAVLTGPAGARMENTVAELCRTLPFSVMCQYDRIEATGRSLEQVTAVHLTGIRERQLCTGDGGAGLALRGSVDLDNEELLAAALRAAIATSAEVVSIDLSRLTFLSVRGCRALVRATHEFRGRGGRVRLVAPQPAVERVIRLLDLDRLVTIVPAGGGSP